MHGCHAVQKSCGRRKCPIEFKDARGKGDNIFAFQRMRPCLAQAAYRSEQILDRKAQTHHAMCLDLGERKQCVAFQSQTGYSPFRDSVSFFAYSYGYGIIHFANFQTERAQGIFKADGTSDAFCCAEARRVSNCDMNTSIQQPCCGSLYYKWMRTGQRHGPNEIGLQQNPVTPCG